MTQPLAPSDLLKVREDGLFRVEGRVLAVRETNLVLADALGAVTMELRAPCSVTAGDIVQCVVEHAASRLVLREMVATRNHPEPGGDSEFSRLALSGRGKLLRARAAALRAIRGFFEEQNFIEVDTPTFVPSPGLDPHVHSLASVKRGERVDHLITSPEFHMKRLLAGGMPRIFQLARCFRAGEEGKHHEPEFTLLEWYRAPATWAETMADTEQVVRRVFAALGNDSLPAEPFPVITVREAFRAHAQIDDAVELAQKHEARYFELLVSHVEPALKASGRPVFLTEYPLCQAALAQPCASDPSVAERYELYVGGVELCNGYGELTDEATQRARFEAELARRAATGEPLYPLDEKFLAALSEGLPSCSGNALGVDRLVALAAGVDNVASTFAFSDAER